MIAGAGTAPPDIGFHRTQPQHRGAPGSRLPTPAGGSPQPLRRVPPPPSMSPCPHVPMSPCPHVPLSPCPASRGHPWDPGSCDQSLPNHGYGSEGPGYRGTHLLLRGALLHGRFAFLSHVVRFQKETQTRSGVRSSSRVCAQTFIDLGNVMTEIQRCVCPLPLRPEYSACWMLLIS